MNTSERLLFNLKLMGFILITNTIISIFFYFFDVKFPIIILFSIFSIAVFSCFYQAYQILFLKRKNILEYFFIQ